MNKRMRKKKHVGEFRVLGFRFVGTFKESNPNIAEKFMDEAIAFVEANDMGIGGGCSIKGFDFTAEVMKRIKNRKKQFGYASATEKHQRLIGQFLASRKDVARSQVGTLFDMFHGSFRDMDESVDSEWETYFGYVK